MSITLPETGAGGRHVCVTLAAEPPGGRRGTAPHLALRYAQGHPLPASRGEGHSP